MAFANFLLNLDEVYKHCPHSKYKPFLYVWTMKGVGGSVSWDLILVAFHFKLWHSRGSGRAWILLWCFPKALCVSSLSDASFCPVAQISFFKRTLSYLQVFGEGTDAVKKSLEGIFDDTVPDGKVKINENKHVFLLEACKPISMCTMLWWGGGGMLKPSTLSVKNWLMWSGF